MKTNPMRTSWTNPLRAWTLALLMMTLSGIALRADAQTISRFDAPRGPVGTFVTITGTDFTGVTSVKFNGTTATHTVNTDTRITTAVPSGATTGKIEVGKAGGTGTSTADFTVTGAVGVKGWGGDYVGRTTGGNNLSGVVAIDGGSNHSVALKSDGTVASWGWDNLGVSSGGNNVSGAVAVSGGSLHSLALKSNGRIVGWGYDGEGRASGGNNLTNVVAISAGQYHSLALHSNGLVSGFGFDHYNRASGGFFQRDVVAIAAGGVHSLALKSDGTIFGWGQDLSGVVSGVNNSNLTDVVAIAAGHAHALALKSDGTVVGFGDDSDGRASGGNYLTNVIAIAAGNSHSLALKSDGTVVGWGYDWDRRASGGSALTNVIAISAGSEHSLALKPAYAPTGIALSNHRVSTSVGATVGTFSSTDADSSSFTYSLVSGDGDTDNVLFAIDAGTLKTAPSFDPGTKTSFSIRVQTSDSDGGVFAKTFTLNFLHADLLIKQRTEPNTSYGGDDRFESTPDGDQIEAISLATVSGVASFSVRVQNDDDAARTFVVKASEDATAGWSAVYRNTADNSDITADITSSGGWSTPARAPGDFVLIWVELTPGANAAASSTKSSILNVYNDGTDVTIKDSVEAQATAPTDLTAPSSSVLIPADGSTINSNGLTQISGEATDSVGVTRVLIFLTRVSNGNTEYWGLNKTSGSFEWSTVVRSSPAPLTSPGGQSVTWKRTNGLPKGANLPEGIYEVRVQAYDAAGNNALSQTNTFTVTAPPTEAIPGGSTPVALLSSGVQLTSASAQVVGSSEAEVKLTFSDVIDGSTASDISHYQVTVNGKPATVQSAMYDALTKTVTLNLPTNAFGKGDQVSVQWSELKDAQGVLLNGKTELLILN